MKLEVIYRNGEIKSQTFKVELLTKYENRIECRPLDGRWTIILFEDAFIITLDDRVVYIDEKYEQEKRKEFRGK